jgi:type IV pilus assembly protein PilB
MTAEPARKVPAPPHAAPIKSVGVGVPSPGPSDVRTNGPVRAGSQQLGQMMIEKAMITPAQLKKALQVQQHGGGPLGPILIKMDAITEQELVDVLALQWGLPSASLKDLNIDHTVVSLIPQHIARRHKVIAIAKTRFGLKLAIADPVNVAALDDVRLVTGLDLELVVVAETEIREAIARYYTTALAADESIRQTLPHGTEPQASGDEVEVAEDQPEEASLEKLQLMVEDPPIVRVVSQITQQAIADGASDIHVEPQQRNIYVRYRIDGMLHDVMALPKTVAAALVSRIKIMASMDIAERRVPQDGRARLLIQGKEYDLRISTMPTVFGESAVMRILDQSQIHVDLSTLGFSSAMLKTWEQLIGKPYGMVLVTGPTGSGKSTTLYASLNKLNTIDRKLLTIEDPVEYNLPRVNQVPVNPKAGLTFANGLRAFLRQDPDIIMVGEIRDRETAEIAMQASLTGHLVLSTLHTNDAPSAVGRLIHMGVEPFLVSSSVLGVLAQRLARKICSHCKEAYKPPQEALRRLGLHPSSEEVVFYHGGGCNRCKGTGYKGRLGVFELMLMSEAVSGLVLKGASASGIRAQAITEGMRTLPQDGTLKVIAGQTTADELFRVVLIDE